MANVLIVGAGGVGNVVARKCAQVPEIFSSICLASRTKAKCDLIASDLSASYPGKIQTEKINADNVPQMVDLICSVKPDVVINVALPYQDLHIMEACLAAGVNYVDTANYEPPDIARFEYKWQWAYHDKFRDAGITGLLGCGFDPGVTNVFTAYAKKHHFDEIHELDIVDCNAGDHGHPFATNFNAEINIREITANGKFYEDGRWVETAPLSVSQMFDFPDGIGEKKVYLLYHEELECLVKHIPTLKRARFWMTFSDNYLKHLDVIRTLGLHRIDPIPYNGTKIVPLLVLKSLLPDPSTLGQTTKGKTCIGCWIGGVKDGKPRRYSVYNVCDHEESYREVKSQAISYTTGVPAMIGAMLVATGAWKRPGVFNPEELDPDPFMEHLNRYGLPWTEKVS